MLEQAHTSPSSTKLASAVLEGREEEKVYIHQFISSLVPRILSHTEVIKYWKYWRRPMPGNEANASQGWCKPSGVTAW